MKIFVTGADGFIGSHVVERLVADGHDVTAFVYYNSFNSWGWLDHASPDVQANINVISGDIRDATNVKAAMAGNEVVIHLAALIAIPFSYDAPDLYLETNGRGTMNVLRAASDLDIHRMVHISTSEVYGSAQFVPINEAHQIVGQSPYAASKIAADQMATAFYRSFDLPVITIRPFNTYGPRQSARAIIPTIITQLHADPSCLRLGALSPTRDLSYISDTVGGILAAAYSDKGTGETVNLGSGFEIGVGDLALLIAEIMGVQPEIISEEKRRRPEKSEVERLWSDNSKAREIMDWAPEFGDLVGLKMGLERTVEWFSEPNNLTMYRPGQYNI